MSRLISKLVLTILVLPLACLLYLIIFAVYQEVDRQTWRRYDEEISFILAGLITWGFIAAYWLVTWGRSVKWTATRLAGTGAVALLAAIAGMIIAAMLWWIHGGLATFIGSAAAPLLWLSATAFVWRESAAERAQRIARDGRGTLICPVCGYNLTGLTCTRCPECGTEPTLDTLVASQPSREAAELV